MKLSSKLLVIPLITTVVFGVAGVTSTFINEQQSEKEITSIYNGINEYKLFSTAMNKLSVLHAQTYKNISIIGTFSDKEIQEKRQNVKSIVSDINVQVKKSIETDKELEAEFKKISILLSKYEKDLDMAIDLSSVDPNTGVAAMQAADSTMQLFMTAMDEMVANNQKRDREETETWEHKKALVKNISLLTSGLLALGLILLAWQMQKKIVKAVNEANDLATSIAHGDLTHLLHKNTDDEIGDLTDNLNKMRTRLIELVQTIDQQARHVAVASDEIAQGNHDLSARTEQQASSLEETAASMEELHATVNRNSETALNADKLSTSAAHTAEKGGTVVQEVVSTMSSIHEASNKIRDIISVIDGIAFQTNILALNAAVEAARAGESGRGFAVVATEVRSLAQKTTSAAKEIKELIQVSVERVESGKHQVENAGLTMNEIVSAINNVKTLVSEIALSSKEQSLGVREVNEAVASMDKGTQQNAAMVEEMAAAASSLKSQSDQLVSSISVFKH